MSQSRLSIEQEPDGDQVMGDAGETNNMQPGGVNGHTEPAGADDVNIADVSNPNFTRRMCTVAE
jgi:hypothetical protein